ncbi:ComEA family DNA-binding protein [Desulfobacterota bacterium AH_259_B03_O07]|nr:ComEA family DNA-binding protein [Desulfobacterota bacterium AH_259_B03_O07]
MRKFKLFLVVPFAIFLFTSYGLAEAAKININTASVEQLVELPGIGESTASKIVAYREQNGGFKTIDDLLNVKGIGERKYEKMKSLITVSN